jgi:hypothetical protein
LLRQDQEHFKGTPVVDFDRIEQELREDCGLVLRPQDSAIA